MSADCYVIYFLPFLLKPYAVGTDLNHPDICIYRELDKSTEILININLTEHLLSEYTIYNILL